jgi:hypothetical protein
MTNLSWVIDGSELTQRHGVKFAILNDFEANGYGVPTLTTEDLLPINDVPSTDKVPPPSPYMYTVPALCLPESRIFFKEYLVLAYPHLIRLDSGYNFGFPPLLSARFGN